PSRKARPELSDRREAAEGWRRGSGRDHRIASEWLRRHGRRVVENASFRYLRVTLAPTKAMRSWPPFVFARPRRADGAPGLAYAVKERQGSACRRRVNTDPPLPA